MRLYKLKANNRYELNHFTPPNRTSSLDNTVSGKQEHTNALFNPMAVMDTQYQKRVSYTRVHNTVRNKKQDEELRQNLKIFEI